MYENAIEGIFQIAPNGQCLNINPALARMAGFDSPEEMLAKPIDIRKRFANRHDRTKVLKALRNTGYVKDFEAPFRMRNGQTNWVSFNARVLLSPKGKILGIEGTVEDITTRKCAEEALQKSEEIFRDISSAMADWIWEINRKGVYIYCSVKAKNLLGYTAEEMIGKTLFEFMPRPDAQRARIGLSRLVGEKRAIEDMEVWHLRKDAEPACLLISGVPVIDDKGRLHGYRGVCKDITGRKKSDEAMRQTMERLRKTLSGAIQALSLTLEWRDPYTTGHQRRVVSLARAIAEELRLPTEQIEVVMTAGIVHDIGKIAVPAEIPAKPSRLSPIEFQLIQTHAQIGYGILKEIEFTGPVAEIVLQHHERMNGSGYPRGLKGEEILLETRILSVADVVESMISHRPYRPAHGVKVALGEIQTGKGVLYDPVVVETCVSLFSENRVGL